MDHEAICDCLFKNGCATFNDRLIDDAQKGPGGLGCRGQADVHRAKHCKIFRCTYLSSVLSDILTVKPKPGAKKP